MNMLVLIGILITVSVCPVSGTLQLNSKNMNDILAKNELVLVNFYTEWCHFSKLLAPIYDDAAARIQEIYPEGKAVLTKIDCDQEDKIATHFKIQKYPTVKLFLYGQSTRREYRGQRSIDGLLEFIKHQFEDPIQTLESLDDLDNLDWNKRNVIGYFSSDNSTEYSVYGKVAHFLRDECTFYAGIGEISERERVAGNKVVYRQQTEEYSDLTYPGALTDYSLLLRWTTDKCIPLVREITFENAEELAEEGLPFLILFHHPEDHETLEIYRKQVAVELFNERNSVVFLTADGLKFIHPLHQLGKSASDLPLLVIDSFKHMFVWKHNAKTDLVKPGLLKQFLADLRSEKLHWEFHHGRDPSLVIRFIDGSAVTQLPVIDSVSSVTALPALKSEAAKKVEKSKEPAEQPHHHAGQPKQVESPRHIEQPKHDNEIKHVERLKDSEPAKRDDRLTRADQLLHVSKQEEDDDGDLPKLPVPAAPTAPPESAFKKLAPSRTRYTILRDEL